MAETGNIPAPDVLARICAETRANIVQAKARTSLDALRSQIGDRDDMPRGFGSALKVAVAQGRYGLIAEIKKASPSGGLIRPDFDPPALARAYRDGGAACLSVLTNAAHFQGSRGHLEAVRAAVDLPVLRKDFILDPWQVYESRAMGADCILLILAALTDTEARELEELARALDMDVLAEVHNEREVERALGLETQLDRHQQPQSEDLGHRSGHHGGAGAAGAARSLPDRRKRHPQPRGPAPDCRGGRAMFPGGREPAARGGRDSGNARAAERRDMSQDFSHFDARGQAAMVDVGAKPVTERTATARARVTMLPATAALIRSGGAKKGDVLAVARIAGIMAAKRTSELIPLCHPLPISAVSLELAVAGDAVEIAATVRTTGQTGVEMEALTAASVAALTVYDMCKSVDRGMRIEALRLTHKAGGKSGEFVQD